MSKRNTISLAAVLIFSLVLSSCIEITTLVQAASAVFGESITTEFEIKTEYDDANAYQGIIGVMLPIDWSVDSVYMSGDYGADYFSFLHPDSADGYANDVDYWTDSLEVRYPSPADMEWRVYQSSQTIEYTLNPAYSDVKIEMTVGETAGDFELGYFFTNAAWDFSDSTVYADTLGNSITISDPVGVEDLNSLPERFDLGQNYPNPFNPSTTIEFSITEASNAILTIYNSVGEEVAEIVNGNYAAGKYAVSFNASDLRSGVYYYTLKTEYTSMTKKMMLLK